MLQNLYRVVVLIISLQKLLSNVHCVIQNKSENLQNGKNFYFSPLLSNMSCESLTCNFLQLLINIISK